ncbi:hypothetical protein HDU97_006251 [Phlyctochytrium planicorne]|nr:hypothetical protein HDU97_006251 [Phlyctochytrium planicorne]
MDDGQTRPDLSPTARTAFIETIKKENSKKELYEVEWEEKCGCPHVEYINVNTKQVDDIRSIADLAKKVLLHIYGTEELVDIAKNPLQFHKVFEIKSKTILRDLENDPRGVSKAVFAATQIQKGEFLGVYEGIWESHDETLKRGTLLSRMELSSKARNVTVGTSKRKHDADELPASKNSEPVKGHSPHMSKKRHIQPVDSCPAKKVPRAVAVLQQEPCTLEKPRESSTSSSKPPKAPFSMTRERLSSGNASSFMDETKKEAFQKIGQILSIAKITSIAENTSLVKRVNSGNQAKSSGNHEPAVSKYNLFTILAGDLKATVAKNAQSPSDQSSKLSTIFAPSNVSKDSRSPKHHPSPKTALIEPKPASSLRANLRMGTSMLSSPKSSTTPHQLDNNLNRSPHATPPKPSQSIFIAGSDKKPPPTLPQTTMEPVSNKRKSASEGSPLERLKARKKQDLNAKSPVAEAPAKASSGSSGLDSQVNVSAPSELLPAREGTITLEAANSRKGSTLRTLEKKTVSAPAAIVEIDLTDFPDSVSTGKVNSGIDAEDSRTKRKRKEEDEMTVIVID